jgi:hypothetical protein
MEWRTAPNVKLLLVFNIQYITLIWLLYMILYEIKYFYVTVRATEPKGDKKCEDWKGS